MKVSWSKIALPSPYRKCMKTCVFWTLTKVIQTNDIRYIFSRLVLRCVLLHYWSWTLCSTLFLKSSFAIMYTYNIMYEHRILLQGSCELLLPGLLYFILLVCDDHLFNTKKLFSCNFLQHMLQMTRVLPVLIGVVNGLLWRLYSTHLYVIEGMRKGYIGFYNHTHLKKAHHL